MDLTASVQKTAKKAAAVCARARAVLETSASVETSAAAPMTAAKTVVQRPHRLLGYSVSRSVVQLMCKCVHASLNNSYINVQCSTMSCSTCECCTCIKETPENGIPY